MNCPYCEHAIDTESKICPNCRAILETVDRKEIPKVVEEEVQPKKDRKELASVVFGIMGVYFALFGLLDYKTIIQDNIELFEMNKGAFALGLSLWQILFASLCIRYSLLAHKIKKNNSYIVTLIMASATYIMTIIHFILVLTYST